MKKHLLSLLFVFAAFVSGAQPVSKLPGLSLEQWWPFCGATDLLDRTFTGFDLLSSNVTATTDRYLQPNRAYLFNGVNSELHYSTTFGIPLFGIADFTYSCHIFPTVAQDAIIIYNGNPTADGLGLIMTNSTGTGPGTYIGVLFGGVTTFVPAGSTVTLNEWHHLLLKRNGNAYMLFVDGTYVGAHIPAGVPAAGYFTPTTVFQAGLDLTSGTRAFTGKIDDIGIWGRQVSHPGEVNQIREFNPSIVFSLGNDTALCPNSFYIGGSRDTNRLDTTKYINYERDTTWGFDYTWSNGDTISSYQELIFPTTPIPPVVRTLTLTRKFSCPASRTITVRHIIPVVNIGPHDTDICEGEEFLLNPDTATGLVRYLWNTGATTSQIMADTAMTYWLRVDSLVPFTNPITMLPDTTHCVATDTTIVDQTPEIFVHLVSNDTSCNGDPITLRSFDDTAYTTPAYLWSDGITTTPTFNAVTTGVYWLRVTDGACIRTDTARIVIANVSTTVLSNDTAICKGASIVANATGTPGVIYQWTPTTGMVNSNIPTPTITPDTSAWYILSARIIEPTLGALLNCVSKDSFFIDVQPNPQILMGGNRQVCQYDSIRIQPTVIPNWYTHYSYSWTPATYLDDATAPAVVFTAGDTTKLIVTVTTPAGCMSSDSAIIYTYNGDFLSMSRDTALCPGDSVVIAPVSTEPGVTYFKWEPSTYVDYPVSPSATPIRPETSISYRVIGTSMFGCLDTLDYSIRVLPAAVITLEDSVVLYPGDSYHIEPVTNTSYYSWSPAVGLSDTAISNPVATPPVDTRYILKAMTQDGCVTSDSISIRLNENSIIMVPNAFVPGSYNSTLKVILKGIARLRYFRVYNRWGKVVFESKNITDGWDGTIGGVDQPAGVYVYEAEAVTDKGKVIQKHGNVTLLR